MKLKPWVKEDGFGRGEYFLPDSKTREAYGKACRDGMIESAARHVLSMKSLERRRLFISKYPNFKRETLKMKIKELWDQQKEDQK